MSPLASSRAAAAVFGETFMARASTLAARSAIGVLGLGGCAGSSKVDGGGAAAAASQSDAFISSSSSSRTDSSVDERRDRLPPYARAAAAELGGLALRETGG